MKRFFKTAALSLTAIMAMAVFCSCGDSSQSTSSSAKPGFPDFVSSGTYEGFEYDQYKTHIVLTKYSGKDVEISVPDSINSLPVTTLEDRVFSNDTSKNIIHKVTLPNTITTIDNSTFYNSRYLEEISVASDNANFKVVDGVLYSSDMNDLIAFPENKQVTEYTVPEGITEIKNNKFAFCQNLKKINLPSTLVSVADFSFHGSTALTEIAFPEGTTSIGSCSFFRCTGLTKITFPSTIKTIASNALVGCTNLKTIEGYAGTEAETTAETLKITFVDLSKANSTDSSVSE